jgi:hypothetical protein
MTAANDVELACYVYGVVPADTELPADLQGLGPTGKVDLVHSGEIAAVIGEAPLDRPLGTRDDLLGHEQVLETLVAAGVTVAPMRFGAVVADEQSVSSELLAPHQDHFAGLLHDLDGRTQFTLTGRYEPDAVLREVVEENPEIRALHEQTAGRSEEESYQQRVQLGELVVAALEEKREVEGAALVDELAGLAVDVVAREPGEADGVVDAAFLVDEANRVDFERLVEDCGRRGAGRVRLRLIGPLPAYDFMPAEPGEVEQDE